MKKLLPALATVLAVSAGGAGLYLAQKPGAFHPGGKFAPADFLPTQTLVLLALPDPARTGEDWKTTDLYKIWTEPDVQAFLAKPLSKIPADPKIDGLRAQITALDPKSLFVAVTALDEGNNHPHVVGGFQFKGPKENLENLLAAPKKQLRDSYSAGKADLLDYQGHAVETFTAPDGTELAATYLGDWYLIANDTALLKLTIDRVEHRAPPGDVPLSKDPDYQTVGGKLPAGYETLIFARPKTFLDRLYALAAASGQPVNPEAKTESQKMRAIGATTSIENGKLRDTIYNYAPGLKQDSAHLGMTSLPLSSTETLLHVASVIQWPVKFDFTAPGSGADTTGGMAALQSFLAGLQARGITADSVRAALGDEGGAQLNWPAASLSPSLLLDIDVKDPAAAQKLVEQLVSSPLGDAPWQGKKDGGHTYYTLETQGTSLLQPTLTLTDKHLILGLDPPQVREAVQREGTNAPNFTAGDTYKAAAALVDKPNVLSAYLDTKGLFERTYGLLRPYAIMGTAFLPAQSTDYIDLTKLPDTEVIAKHLTPSVFSQTLDKDGTKIDSIGSVTFAQGGAVLGGATSAVLVTVFAKDSLDKFLPGWYLKSIKPGPATTPAPEPDATPTPAAAAPSSSP